MYKSVVNTNAQALDTISGLYLQGDLHMDTCYGRGDMYRGSVLVPEIKHDIETKVPGVYPVDCRQMPYPSACTRSVMFDPPWLIGDGNFALAKRYGSFPLPADMFAFQDAALMEISRILIPGGWLVTKLQDCSHGRQKYFLSVYQPNRARDFNLFLVDSIVLVNSSRLRNKGAGVISSVSTHCFFNVYRKQVRQKRVIRY